MPHDIFRHSYLLPFLHVNSSEVSCVASFSMSVYALCQIISPKILNCPIECFTSTISFLLSYAI
uniref:Uncharacterized protein n=1 Tax=Arundo donax TaxID=35708 RepID=A0A0A9BKS9_ARUDO